MVALTGVEPDGWQFRRVQMGLSGCVFSAVGIPGCSGTPPRTADVTAQSQRSFGRRGAGEAATLGRCGRRGFRGKAGTDGTFTARLRIWDGIWGGSADGNRTRRLLDSGVAARANWRVLRLP